MRSNNRGPVRWPYPLRGASINRESSRTSTTQEGVTYDLWGIDGSLLEGVRPFPGFRHVRTMTANLNTNIQPTSAEALARQASWGPDSGDTPFPTIVGRQRVSGFFPVQGYTTNNQRYWGFIYRVIDETDPVPNARIFFEYNINNEWYTVADLIGWQSNGNQPMDVEVAGRFIYIAVRGQAPVRVYITTRDPSSSEIPDFDGKMWNLVVNENTGPGLKPLLSQGEIILSSTGTIGVDQPLPPTDANVPANGHVRSWNSRNAWRGAIWAAGPAAPAPLSWNFWPNVTASNPVGDGPYDTDATWTVKSVENVYPVGLHRLEEGINYGFDASGAALPGFRVSPDFFDAGTTQVITKVGENAPQPNPRGSTTIAVQLFDSRTGLRSNISEIAMIGVSSSIGNEGEPREGWGWTEQYLYYNVTATSPLDGEEGTKTLDVSGTWVNDFQGRTAFGLHLVYDANKFDRALIYRSVVSPPGTSTPEQFRILQLDDFITLEDYHVQNSLQPSSPWKRAVYALKKNDAALSASPTYRQGADAFAVPPKGSALLFKNGMMLYGGLDQPPEENAGVSAIYWSDPASVSPEVVFPLNRYNLDNAAEEVFRFLDIGEESLGLTDTNLYGFRREGLSVRGANRFPSYGAVAPRAACTMGPMALWLNDEGFKSYALGGQLSDMTVFDEIIKQRWRTSRASVQMAYDSTMKTVFALNTETSEACCFWFTKQRASMLMDVGFSHVNEGMVPDVEGQSLKRRACFLKEGFGSNPSYADPYHDNTDYYEWQVFVPDYNRATEGRRLIEVGNGDVVMNYGSAITSGASFGGNPVHRITVSSPKPPSLAEGVPDRIENTWVYVLSGAQAGQKARVLRRISPTVFHCEPGGGIDWAALSLEPGVKKLGFVPVSVMWGSAPLPDFNDVNGVYFTDHTRRRQLNTIQPTFSSVTGETDAQWQAVAWLDNQPTFASAITPKNPRDKSEFGSIRNGPAPVSGSFGATSPHHGLLGTYVSAGLRVFWPDVDYTIESVVCRGSIGGELSNERIGGA